MMICLLVTFRLGLQDLLSHRSLALIMALSIGIASGMLAILQVYRGGMTTDFHEPMANLLLVHESQIIGEFYGSRLPGQMGETLSKMGVSLIIPEIHEVVGTFIENATLLRGIDLAQYTRLESFSMLSGRSLRPGDPPRLAMIGARLAASRHLNTGDVISLRGRAFSVVGIFENGSYMDNQAWISLADAQQLLGWGTDVSVFIIPDEGILHAGDRLPGGESVSRKGESLQAYVAQSQRLLDLLSVVALAVGASAALALINNLWRLAWLRRRELAILRTTGFSTLSLTGYLLVQGLGITLLGILLGVLDALIFTSAVRMSIDGFTIFPRVDASTLLPSLGWVSLMVLAGTLLPAWWLSRLNLNQLLRSE